MSDQPLNLAIAAQDAASERLEHASTVALYEEDADTDVSEEDYQASAAQLSAPYCGCITCVVREVIDAAWPYLSVYAVMQYQDAMSDPEVRAQVDKLAAKVRSGEFPSRG